MGGWRKQVVWWALTLSLAGCTTATPAADSPETDTAATESTAEGSPATPTTTSALASSSAASSSAASSSATSTTVDPLRPHRSTSSTSEDNNSASAWISRTSMTASEIGLQWSTSDGAIEYQVHRLARTTDERPDVAAMTMENLVHTATDSGRWTDEGVVAGTPYWYGIRALAADGSLVAHGWHRAAAVTDDEPPTPVGTLTVVVDGGDVLVTWTPPDENYELHGYRVFRGVDGQEPESISTTWNIDQTSFIDDDPPTGQVTYRVVAFDFHWNDSAPADAAIDLS